MLLFSKEVNNWMAQDPENVVAIHCKGGKGNTTFFLFLFFSFFLLGIFLVYISLFFFYFPLC